MGMRWKAEKQTCKHYCNSYLKSKALCLKDCMYSVPGFTMVNMLLHLLKALHFVVCFTFADSLQTIK